MKTNFALGLALCVALVLPVFAHDLFLKPDRFFADVNSRVSISVLNGSFLSSEGPVTFARLKDISVVGPDGERRSIPESDFTKNETTSFLNFTPAAAGTYVAGLSTMPREIDLKAKDFNEYLVHDGIPDTLADRRRKGQLGVKVRERYSKHVKTILQAGDVRSENYRTPLGYPVELVPQTNPYELRPGSTMSVLCLKDGQPLANQYVMTGRETQGKVVAGQSVRSDKNGIATVRLPAPGKWYVRFIQMNRSSEPKLNYESKWATLTFEIK